MSFEATNYELENRVAILTLNCPEAMNSWNNQMREDALSLINEVKVDENIRVVILTGEGRAFSAGADIGRLSSFIEGKIPFPGIGESTHLVVKELHKVDKPLIAAVNGADMGIGFSIALACDIRIASENARFGALFVKRGLIPDGGCCYSLPRIVGPGMAARLIFTGDVIDAQEAARIGLVCDVVPAAELMIKAKNLAHSIAENAPLALRMAKLSLEHGINATDFESQVNHEMYVQETLFRTEDFKEGIQSLLEKRESKFSGK